MRWDRDVFVCWGIVGEGGSSAVGELVVRRRGDVGTDEVDVRRGFDGV